MVPKLAVKPVCSLKLGPFLEPRVHTYQPVQNQKQDKISEKRDFWSKIGTFLRKQSKLSRGKLVHKNTVKKVEQSEEKVGQQ